MLLTPQRLIDLNQRFFFRFNEAFTREVPVLWPRKATRIDTNAEVNVYGWLASMPGWREWVGPRLFHNLVARNYFLKNKDWEFSFAVPRNAIKYDQLGIYADRAAVAGAGARMLWDEVVTAAQLAGHTTVCWDGQFFYDTDHPNNFDSSGAGTYSNNFPTTTLTYDNVNARVAGMMTLVDENGKSLRVRPNVLEVGPSLRAKGREIIEQMSRVVIVKNVAGDQNVAAAAVDNLLKGELELMVNPDLVGAHADVWFLHATDGPIKPFLLQVGQDPTPLIAKDNPSDENVFHRKEFEYGSDASGVAGYTLPFLSVRCKET